MCNIVKIRELVVDLGARREIGGVKILGGCYRICENSNCTTIFNDPSHRVQAVGDNNRELKK